MRPHRHACVAHVPPCASETHDLIRFAAVDQAVKSVLRKQTALPEITGVSTEFAIDELGRVSTGIDLGSTAGSKAYHRREAIDVLCHKNASAALRGLGWQGNFLRPCG